MFNDSITSGQAVATFPYRLAAIDIDDTLIGPDREIGSANHAAVDRLREAGCQVVLASGRRHVNMLPYARKLELSGYIVSCQGARAQHMTTGEIIHSAELSPADAAALTHEGLARGLTVFRWNRDGIYTNREDSWTQVYRHESGNDEVNIADIATMTGGAEKIVWSNEPARLLHEVASPEVAGWRKQLSCVITNDWYLEFSAAGAHKAAGIAAVADRLDISPKQVLTFGEGNNDVTMLQWAGMGIAMPHGREGAKLAAKRVGRAGDPESALARAVDDLFAELR